MLRLCSTLLVLVMLSLALPSPPLVAPLITDPLGYVCYRADQPIKIDGKLDDEAWTAAPWSEDFVDILGHSKIKPPLRTRVKMLWDDQYLYIAAELEEPHLWATLTKHDSVIFKENDFEVFLDPDGDNQNYCELELNARNTTWDLLLSKPYRDDGRAVSSWEIAGLKTAVHLDGTLNDPRDKDRGWTLEIAWPFTDSRN
jgi:Carbohydrate family 9 binding domain-like